MKTLLFFVHPYPRKSRLNVALRDAAARLDQVTVRDLYERYPDFYIDVPAEQRLLLEHELIVFQHPMQWFGAPALLKEWFDMVLRRGWAYGERRALQGKHWLQAVSTGEPEHTFGPDGRYGMTMHELLRPFEASARLCGMRWHQPFLVYRKAALDPVAIERQTESYVARLEQLRQSPLGGSV